MIALDVPLARPRHHRAPARMTIAQAKAIAGSLGEPSKMPGWSYGLHARQCAVGAELAKVPGSTCFNCFALKNFYATWKPALIARDRRHVGIRHPRWVEAMVRLLERYAQPPDDHFRWHDSGDLQDILVPYQPIAAKRGDLVPASALRAKRDRENLRSAAERLAGQVLHLANIASVCRQTPWVTHWLPTKEYGAVEAYLGAHAEGFPENLTVRLSAYMIDTEPVVPPALAHLPTVTVHTAMPLILVGKGNVTCQAIEKRDNVCGNCRACWDRRVSNVSYPEH